MIFFTDYFSLFLIIAFGLILGRLKIRGLSLDISAVIFVALLFGHLGVKTPDVFQVIGLMLFIYAVGVQAGPVFFDSFKKKGIQFVLLGVILVVSAVITTIIVGKLFGIDMNMAVGLFTGALTSTPGLASAIEASTKPELASIGYGIAYPFGVIGVILFVNLVPRIFHIDLKKEAAAFEAEAYSDHPEIMHRHFVVNNKNIINQTIGELKIRNMTGATISRVCHNSKTTRPSPKTVLHKGDLVRAVGTIHSLEKLKLLIGPVTKQDIPIDKKAEAKWFIVTNKKIVNKTLAQLNLFSTFGATVTRLRRSGIEISPNLNSQIRFGDKLLIVCTSHLNEITDLLGNEDKRLLETDFLPVSIGLLIGVMLGTYEFGLGAGLTFKLGITGGVLLSALTLSRMGKLGPVIWNSAGPANQFMRQFGLLLFLATVGTKAGANLAPTWTAHGYQLFIIGAIITLLPMIIATLVGRLVFKMNFLTLLGLLAGGMTSTPGLTAVDSLTESNAPSIAYAAVYPVAMVLLVILSQIICQL